jgi:ferric-dicitrate binding protein FerR (iron transport regulator)
MTEHRAKTAALLAFEAGRLSTMGRARVEAHLGRCATCRRELAAMRVYGHVRAEVHRTPPPEVDWSRVEQALAREAQHPPRPPWRSPLTVTAAALVTASAAAALIVMWLAPPSHPSTAGSTGATPSTATDATAQAARPRPLEPQVTATAGQVHIVRPGMEPAPLAAGDHLSPGASIRTGPGSQVHLRFTSGTGAVLGERGAVRIDTSTTHAIHLALEAGVVSHRVRRGGPLGDFRVTAGAYQVRVVGTRFAVQRQGDEVAVRVTEGTVEVLYGGQPLQVLKGPAQWGTEGAEAADDLEPVPPRGVEADATAWTVLRLPPSDRVRAWELDGLTFEALHGGVTLGLPPGEVRLRALLRTGDRVPVDLSIGATGHRLAEADLGDLLPEPVGHLPRAEITETIRQAGPALQSCYERAMRLQPDLSGRHTLQVRVGRSGIVQEARLLNGSPDGAPGGELTECVAGALRKRAFPAPRGGPITFEVPLSFQHVTP